MAASPRYFLKILLALSVVALIYFFIQNFLIDDEGKMLQQIEELKVKLISSTAIPEPTNVISTSDWYYLDHISSGLAGYDAEKKVFAPVFAESWEVKSDGTHLFKIKKNQKFHDGTPLTAKDILWSIKRHLIFRTSTHFPLWDYIVDCESVKSLTDECSGLKLVSENEILIKLKVQTDSFFLQLASPETGIWSIKDMDEKTGELKPTKFSGPYFVDSKNNQMAILKRNENSPISQKFLKSPKIVKFLIMPLSETTNALNTKQVDLALKQYSPYSDENYKDIEIQSTTPSSIIYLFGLGNKYRPDIGKDFLINLWQNNSDKTIVSGHTFLPFANEYSLSKEEFLSELSETRALKLRILCPEGFFSKKFLDMVTATAKKSNIDIIFSFAGPKDFFAVFSDIDATKKYDYVMSLYVASERYPAVQLRYMTKTLVTPPIDLKPTETPDLDQNKKDILKSYQKWLLKSKLAIPLFFSVTQFLHQKNIDLGHQSMSDGEIELWRVMDIK